MCHSRESGNPGLDPRLKHSGMTLILFLLFSVPLSAETLRREEIIPLEVSQTNLREICSTYSATGKKVIWEGVRDVRPTKELGMQTRKKGKEVIVFVPDRPLEKIMDDAFRNLFQTCGVKNQQRASEETSKISVEIVEFQLTGEKKLVTEKQKGMSRLAYLITRGPMETRLEIEVEASEKEIRKTGTKRFQAITERLLVDTLREVPKQVFADLK